MFDLIRRLARTAWTCDCGYRNADTDSNCGGCGTAW